MAEKRPSLQFYPGDWLRDPGVRSVSLEARGLWIDMLCLMFESDRKGFLQLNDKPVSAEQLARMTGCSPDVASRLLTELETSGVFSRMDNGMIFSRRMVRDERKRALCTAAGKKGGNPTLKGSPKGESKGEANRNPTPSSSSSSSSSEPPNPQERKGRPPPYSEIAARLAQEWCMAYIGTLARERNPYVVAAVFQEWMDKLGVTESALRTAIANAARDKTEPTWQLKDRVVIRGQTEKVAETKAADKERLARLDATKRTLEETYGKEPTPCKPTAQTGAATKAQAPF